MNRLVAIVFAFAVLLLAGCAASGETDIITSAGKLKLANGNTISQAGSDDYNPIMVQLANGYLALVFGSTRSCALSCANHNIFVASSVAPYTGNGILPAFHEPQPLVENGFSPLNYVTPFRLAVAASGNNIIIYAQVSIDMIRSTGAINPVSAGQINLGASFNTISEYNCYNHRLLGLDAAGLMIATNTGGTLVFRFNPNTVGGGSCGTIANVSLAAGSHISLLGQNVTGIADSFFVSNASGSLRAESAISSGRKINELEAALSSEGLISTHVSVLRTSSAADDLIIFSAAPGAGQKSDLYVATRPTPAELWLRHAAPGAQP